MRSCVSGCLWLQCLAVAVAGLTPVTPTWGQAADLENLPALRDYESHRITSADPTGGNADGWDIASGATRVLADIQGSGCIVHFRDNITSREPHHLQRHVLRIYWDGEESPSVEAPIGDFFGVGFGFTEKVSSALVCIDQRPGKITDPAAMGAARNAYFPMPFARAARITLTNEGKESSRHWVEVNYRTYKKPPESQLYFHAQYRQATPPPEGPYLILDAKGRGHLVGCVLSVKNNDRGWWGEGDEILFIDGKHAIQGTGSEDYFCESYGLRIGCFPYFGVTLLEEPYTTAYRWHVPDPVTFRESLRFLIEHGNGAPSFRSGNFYYSVAYWYQTEPHAPFLTPPGRYSGWHAGDQRREQSVYQLIFHLTDGQMEAIDVTPAVSASVNVLGEGQFQQGNALMVLGNKVAAFIGVPFSQRRPPTFSQVVDGIRSVLSGTPVGEEPRK